MLVDVGVLVEVAVAVAVAVAVFVTAPLLFVAVAVPVVAAPLITITTNTSSPKYCPPAVDMRQLPLTVPVLLGATIAIDKSIVEPVGTDEGRV